MTTMLADARAEALFCCAKPTGAALTKQEAVDAIGAAVRAHGGTRGCACDVAAEFADYPAGSVTRMRWAVATVASLFGGSELVWSRAVAS